MKSQIHKKLALVAMLISLVFVATNVTAKKPVKPPPVDDPVFTAFSDNPPIAPIDSHSLDNGGQIVFRHTEMDLSQFEGSDAAGDECFLRRPADNGILVLKPKSRKVATVARLEYWFQAELDSGDTVTHLFVMEGEFENMDDWPPLGDETETTLTFNSWEFAAENKWAQRQDCAGESYDFSDPPWTVTITREE